LKQFNMRFNTSKVSEITWYRKYVMTKLSDTT
jgi:hypothetical protein